MRRNDLISVVICTHNRADLAQCAIASVLAQDFSRNEYELLIVDNASKDHTREMALEFCDKNSNVRYIFEGNLGLSNARNRGWQDAQGEYVAYIDDDCIVPTFWLSVAFKVIEQEHPVAFGGPSYAFYNVQKPTWFKDEYGSHVMGKEPRPLKAEEYLDGLNMFLRVDNLKNLGGFDEELGMKGKKIGYGEDTKLFDLLRHEKSDNLLYVPDLFLFHLVRPEKLGLWTNMRMNYFSGYYSAKICKQPKSVNLVNIVGVFINLIRIIKSVTWDLIRRDRLLYPYFQNFLFEVSFKYISRLGYYIGRWSECTIYSIPRASR
jgi:glycosyltransferase involved in cell wall biosynthesis